MKLIKKFYLSSMFDRLRQEDRLANIATGQRQGRDSVMRAELILAKGKFLKHLAKVISADKIEIGSGSYVTVDGNDFIVAMERALSDLGKEVDTFTEVRKK